MKGNIITVPIRKVDPTSTSAEQDLVAVEEPLQIRLGDRDFAITMRTPGQDRELAAGFLFTEGVIDNLNQVRSITTDARGAVTVDLAAGVEVNFAARNFYVTSSCGVCGKASIDGLKSASCAAPPHRVPKIDASVIPQLPDKLRQSQPV